MNPAESTPATEPPPTRVPPLFDYTVMTPKRVPNYTATELTIMAEVINRMGSEPVLSPSAEVLLNVWTSHLGELHQGAMLPISATPAELMEIMRLHMRRRCLEGTVDEALVLRLLNQLFESTPTIRFRQFRLSLQRNSNEPVRLILDWDPEHWGQLVRLGKEMLAQTKETTHAQP